ncbi:DNA-formamidopyrimidine glycosylase family protein [Arthrobacter sp. zg-Y820]|uniref:Fpg/Nei family DNA glycosylase n=1 Tax=unclassified Arthrobacter TaxID=235627 RepID=UPI001E34DA5C|nr:MULTISPECIES: DNA-formamidopyrimidine glycosylase family protein [unclassified Arthrobacter]MCC9198299.1 zf-TFIIB domain-containing protein [Arthrobacter sp. zg-Y820]MDK1281169.1 DNA-formamidopyrimidine glycosylase family protein [Arthrobacter sp. zg.Y820]MDK1361523.1 DNA-formamidopyrimidine glycosylase family protein [Arthrobacter sp. zg-Y1219]WIB09762.1 DNA-formamidopyrimidine glycosylase family protein [Arthrobacter sp. zg-Y820]
MPEMPEVQGLADFLREKLLPPGAPPAVISDVEVLSFAVLKTAEVPLDVLQAGPVSGVERRGKFIILTAGGVHLVMHLARAGWLRWSDALAPGRLKPGKGRMALRVRFASGGPDDDGGVAPGFDLTEAGTKKSLAVYLVKDPLDVPGIARLGPEAFDVDYPAFAQLVAAHRGQIKGLLRDQSVIAGIGNAYSDEILHAAHLSPFATAARLTSEEVERLYQALRAVLESAIANASGRPAAELKDSKRRAMRVHARTGEPCPVCGDTVREVSFADSSLQYCPTCQTGGKLLADRRLSRLLK